MDAQISHHIKGDVTWALGPKAKHEIIRGQWGRELKGISLQELLKLFKKPFCQRKMYFTAEHNSLISSKKTTRHLMNTGKYLWLSEESANSTKSHQKE